MLVFDSGLTWLENGKIKVHIRQAAPGLLLGRTVLVGYLLIKEESPTSALFPIIQL